jgi:uncharacterized protein
MRAPPKWSRRNWRHGCADLSETPFWERPLDTLSRAEWEALCDGCGKCCLHKVEDEDTGHIYPTNVACKLLDLKTCQCADYRNRRMHVPDCIRLARGRISNFSWLPSTCAYVLREAGEPLPDWHHLISGSRDTIHQTGHSIAGKAISELHAGPLENHIVDQPL